jgi:hypothetical protein
MSYLQKYEYNGGLKYGNMVRLDESLYHAVTRMAMEVQIPDYATFVRSVLAAVTLNKTYVSIHDIEGLKQEGLGETRTEIKVLNSQIEELSNQVYTLSAELRNKQEEVRLKDIQIAQLLQQIQTDSALIPSESAQIRAVSDDISNSQIPTDTNRYQPNQPSVTQQFAGSGMPMFQTEPAVPNQPFRTEPIVPNQPITGLEHSEFGNKGVPAPLEQEIEPLEIDLFISKYLIQIVSSQLVKSYFEHSAKLNQQNSILAQMGGSELVLEQIPNSLLEHHPYVVMLKKEIGQYEMAINTATDAFWGKVNSLEQMSQIEQMALQSLMQRERMLWWLITYISCANSFDEKLFSHLIEQTKLGCAGFPAIQNPYHESVIITQSYGAK